MATKRWAEEGDLKPCIWHCQVGVKRRGSAHDSFWRAGLTCVEAAGCRGISDAFLLFSDVFHAKLTMPLPRHSASRRGGAIALGKDGLFGQQRREAEKCRERMGDDVGGYSRKEGAHTTLVFEAVAKRAGGKARTELRHDAASYVDSTARTERQGKIAGDGSEHGTEHLDGFTAVRFLFANLRICDLRGRVGSSRNAVDLSERVVEVDEARTRQEPFG